MTHLEAEQLAEDHSGEVEGYKIRFWFDWGEAAIYWDEIPKRQAESKIEDLCAVSHY